MKNAPWYKLTPVHNLMFENQSFESYQDTESAGVKKNHEWDEMNKLNTDDPLLSFGQNNIISFILIVIFEVSGPYHSAKVSE